MRCLLRTVWRAVPFLLLAAIVLGALLYPVPLSSGEADARIVRIWNVDTFEGGKGSRTAFLSRVAQRAEQGREGVYFRVLSYTAEGARAAMAQGERPDLLSFGVGAAPDAALCRALPYVFAGGRLAVPWCRGAYYLFSLTEDLTAAGETVISSGGSNLACAAARFASVQGEESESLAAYLDFLGGKFRYLLGTQRDVCRFAARGVTVYSRALPDYCDLYQYICLLSDGEDGLYFLETLFSADVQAALSDIGMMTAAGASGWTVNAFSTPEQLAETARAVRAGEAQKNPEKFFESV